MPESTTSPRPPARGRDRAPPPAPACVHRATASRECHGGHGAPTRPAAAGAALGSRHRTTPESFPRPAGIHSAGQSPVQSPLRADEPATAVVLPSADQLPGRAIQRHGFRCSVDAELNSEGSEGLQRLFQGRPDSAATRLVSPAPGTARVALHSRWGSAATSSQPSMGLKQRRHR